MRSFANGKKMKNPEKSEKGIDKVEKKWYNNKAVGESVKQKQSSSQGWKNSKKVLENPLTNRQQSDIINKLSTERSRRNRSLKIEQQ